MCEAGVVNGRGEIFVQFLNQIVRTIVNIARVEQVRRVSKRRGKYLAPRRHCFQKRQGAAFDVARHQQGVNAVINAVDGLVRFSVERLHGHTQGRQGACRVLPAGTHEQKLVHIQVIFPGQVKQDAFPLAVIRLRIPHDGDQAAAELVLVGRAVNDVYFLRVHAHVYQFPPSLERHGGNKVCALASIQQACLRPRVTVGVDGQVFAVPALQACQ